MARDCIWLASSFDARHRCPTTPNPSFRGSPLSNPFGIQICGGNGLESEGETAIAGAFKRDRLDIQGLQSPPRIYRPSTKTLHAIEVGSWGRDRGSQVCFKDPSEVIEYENQKGNKIGILTGWPERRSRPSIVFEREPCSLLHNQTGPVARPRD